MVTGELSAVKASISRIETDKYGSKEARSDFAWRDERAADHGRRISQLEIDMRRKH
jgi:hypothetical protein